MPESSIPPAKMAKTFRLPGDLANRLVRTAGSNALSRTDVLRLALDVGLSRVEKGLAVIAEGSGGKPTVAMDAEQLAEARELYKSAVTDVVPGVEKLHGKKFAAIVLRKLPGLELELEVLARVKRFLDVYIQLF